MIANHKECIGWTSRHQSQVWRHPTRLMAMYNGVSLGRFPFARPELTLIIKFNAKIIFTRSEFTIFEWFPFLNRHFCFKNNDQIRQTVQMESALIVRFNYSYLCGWYQHGRRTSHQTANFVMRTEDIPCAFFKLILLKCARLKTWANVRTR